MKKTYESKTQRLINLVENDARFKERLIELGIATSGNDGVLVVHQKESYDQLFNHWTALLREYTREPHISKVEREENMQRYQKEAEDINLTHIQNTLDYEASLHRYYAEFENHQKDNRRRLRKGEEPEPFTGQEVSSLGPIAVEFPHGIKKEVHTNVDALMEFYQQFGRQDAARMKDNDILYMRSFMVKRVGDMISPASDYKKIVEGTDIYPQFLLRYTNHEREQFHKRRREHLSPGRFQPESVMVSDIAKGELINGWTKLLKEEHEDVPPLKREGARDLKPVYAALFGNYELGLQALEEDARRIKTLARSDSADLANIRQKSPASNHRI